MGLQRRALAATSALLSDAEAGKHAAKHLLGSDPPGDTLQRPSREPHIFRRQLRAAVQSRNGGRESISRFRQPLLMPQPRGRREIRSAQQLDRLAKQANLPETAAVQVYDFRTNTLKESNRIYDDAALNPEQKRAALQTLAQNARNEIVSTLGADVGGSYLKVAERWLTGLDRGAAVTFTAGGGMSTRVVPVQRRTQSAPAAPVTAPAK